VSGLDCLGAATVLPSTAAEAECGTDCGAELAQRCRQQDVTEAKCNERGKAMTRGGNVMTGPAVRGVRPATRSRPWKCRWTGRSGTP
jgi:hypothetical protein